MIFDDDRTPTATPDILDDETPTATPERDGSIVAFGSMPLGFDASPRERKRIRLEEYDIEVATRIDAMKGEITTLVNKLRKEFKVEMIKIPRVRFFRCTRFTRFNLLVSFTFSL